MTGEPGRQANGHRQSQDAAEWASPFARPSSRAGTSRCLPMQLRLLAAHLRDPVAGLVQTKDSLTIYKAHLFRLSTVECFHEIIRQQARI